jgi:nucleoside-diphosphate-sugar epimerase
MELAFTYVSDAVSGIFFALLNGDELVYNVGNSSEIIRVRDLAEIVTGLYPEMGLKVVYDIPTEATGYLANRVAFLDVERVVKLGWSPKIMLDNGFLRTINSLM